jgi:prevent-host-death family protein
VYFSGVSENEIGLRELRTQVGDLVNRAEYAGEITYITRHGRRAAAIVPIDRITGDEDQEPTMTCFTRDNANPEWGTDSITITQRGSEVTENAHEDGIDRVDHSGFSSPAEAEEFVRNRTVDLEADGYREQ